MEKALYLRGIASIVSRYSACLFSNFAFDLWMLSRSGSSLGSRMSFFLESRELRFRESLGFDYLKS